MSGKGVVIGALAMLAVGLVVYRLPGDQGQDPASTAEQRTAQAIERSFATLTEDRLFVGDAQDIRMNPQINRQSQQFRLAADGSLVVDEDTRTLLDVLLTGLARHPGRADIDKLEKDISAGLAPDPSRQLARLLRSYVAYRDAETDLGERQRADPSLTPELALDQLRDMRITHFGEPLAAALFLKEEKRMRADLAATRPGAAAPVPDSQVAADPVLDRLLLDVAALRSTGASESSVAVLREQVLGKDRAQQLQDMEQSQADWELRSQTFLAAVKPGADNQEMEGVLRGLYTEQELQAARAYNLERLRGQHQSAVPGKK